jgi:hypothetical protein
MDGASTLTGPFIGHAVPADLRGIRAVFRLVELHFVVLHDDRSAALDVIEQPMIVGAQIGAPLVGADAGHDHVVLRQVAPGQFVLDR